jgi:acyl-CoA thioester hydrolase
MKKIEFEQHIYSFDIDFARHVNNAVYIRWMEIGRTNLITALGLGLDATAERGFTPVLTYTEISYKKPLSMGDSVKIEVWISDLQNASAILEFRFYNQLAQLVATGRQKGLFLNLETQRPYRLSPEDRAKFEPYVWASESKP